MGIVKKQWFAIKRTVFSLCIFELEDTVLGVIDEALRSAGWVVSSLQFDGCHVAHRKGCDFPAALRRAEAASTTPAAPATYS